MARTRDIMRYMARVCEYPLSAKMSRKVNHTNRLIIISYVFRCSFHFNQRAWFQITVWTDWKPITISDPFFQFCLWKTLSSRVSRCMVYNQGQLKLPFYLIWYIQSKVTHADNSIYHNLKKAEFRAFIATRRERKSFGYASSCVKQNSNSVTSDISVYKVKVHGDNTSIYDTKVLIGDARICRVGILKRG